MNIKPKNIIRRNSSLNVKGVRKVSASRIDPGQGRFRFLTNDSQSDPNYVPRSQENMFEKSDQEVQRDIGSEGHFDPVERAIDAVLAQVSLSTNDEAAYSPRRSRADDDRALTNRAPMRAKSVVVSKYKPVLVRTNNLNTSLLEHQMLDRHFGSDGILDLTASQRETSSREFDRIREWLIKNDFTRDSTPHAKNGFGGKKKQKYRAPPPPPPPLPAVPSLPSILLDVSKGQRAQSRPIPSSSKQNALLQELRDKIESRNTTQEPGEVVDQQTETNFTLDPVTVPEPPPRHSSLPTHYLTPPPVQQSPPPVSVVMPSPPPPLASLSLPICAIVLPSLQQQASPCLSPMKSTPPPPLPPTENSGVRESKHPVKIYRQDGKSIPLHPAFDIVSELQLVFKGQSVGQRRAPGPTPLAHDDSCVLRVQGCLPVLSEPSGRQVSESSFTEYPRHSNVRPGEDVIENSSEIKRVSGLECDQSPRIPGYATESHTGEGNGEHCSSPTRELVHQELTTRHVHWEQEVKTKCEISQTEFCPVEDISPLHDRGGNTPKLSESPVTERSSSSLHDLYGDQSANKKTDNSKSAIETWTEKSFSCTNLNPDRSNVLNSRALSEDRQDSSPNVSSHTDPNVSKGVGGQDTVSAVELAKRSVYKGHQPPFFHHEELITRFTLSENGHGSEVRRGSKADQAQGEARSGADTQYRRNTEVSAVLSGSGRSGGGQRNTAAHYDSEVTGNNGIVNNCLGTVIDSNLSDCGPKYVTKPKADNISISSKCKNGQYKHIISSSDLSDSYGQVNSDQNKVLRRRSRSVEFDINSPVGWDTASLYSYASDESHNNTHFDHLTHCEDQIFKSFATVSACGRADRTLTGSLHNIAYSSRRGNGHLNSDPTFSLSDAGQRESKKKPSFNLVARFFSFNRKPDRPFRYQVEYSDDQNGAKSSESAESHSNVEYFTFSSEHFIVDSKGQVDATGESTMLSSHNHDHERLPPSAATASSSSLLRSRSLFSSTPSLFSKSSQDEKMWKKELKREKEERKKMEEERKRLEKEEKKRLKLMKKSATVSGKSLSKDKNNYYARPVQSLYAQPQLRMTAVPIDYQDDPRLPPPQQPPPPPPEQYATARQAYMRDGYSVYSRAPHEQTRVEQLYGTTPRHSASLYNTSHYAAPFGLVESREQHPRVVLLHRSAEGYGFVLRGAKSKIPTGGTFNDFQPSAEYPALQYLDSVDVGSQADRAGLKKGDFILEINGENVVRASHEHVVHLIRSSSNVLTLKVVTVTHADSTPADWAMHSDGSMTLPARKKQAAPLPPQRDPRTSLSYSKASSKSMTEGLEGLAEIEKLDATIAEFEGQEASRRLSLHADDPKIASIRGSHTVKRVSVVDYESLMSGEPSNARGVDHVSPAEARIKKYHKKSASQTMERSKSTPDIISALENQYGPSYGIQTGNNLGGRGTWTKNQAPAPPSQASGYSGTLQASSVDQPYLMTAVTSGTGSYSRGSNPSIPNDASRRQANQRIAPGAPSTPELVRIHTGAKSNVRADTESPYESSFRPGASALLVDKSSLPSSEISKKNAPNTDKSITFADDRVLENAQKFIQKHPNATLLVTADIHLDEPVKKGTVYEPEPDYDDSGDEKSGPPNFKKPVSNVQVSDVVKQNRAAVTVISITSEKANSKAPAPSSMHSSPSSSRRSSPLMTHMPDRTLMSGQRSSQPSSTESSRRSSIQSNMSAEGGERSGRMQMSSAAPPPPPPGPPPPLVGPPPPPPPPISALLEPSFSTSGNATLARRQQAGGNEALPPRVSALDIMAAVAERKSRLETEGPRLLEVKPISTNKTRHELNQEALKAAVALRKSRIEQTEDTTVVDEIEARLNRNKKLQAAKFVGGDVKKQIEVKKEEPNESVVSTAVSLTTTGLGANAQKPKEVVAKLESSSAVSQGKVTSGNLKPINALEKPLSTISAKESETNGTIDFRSRLKPVDVKGTTSSVVLPSKINVAPTLGNKTEVTMTNKSSKAPSPPPVKAPIMSASTSVSTVSLSNKATTNSSESHTNTLKSSKSGQDATSGDYIALAEKARQEYLKKKASGNLQSHIEKKGPVEITPTRKHSSPTSPTSSSPNMTTSKSNGTTLIEVKPASSSGEKVNVIRSQVGFAANKNMPVKGVTEDHSHTEQSLSNGTIKKPKTNGTVSPPPGLIPPPQHGFESIVAPPPPGFDDHDGSRLKTVVLDIIPPPMSFGSSLNNSPEHGNHMPAFSQEDNASFVSSVSSLSTLSSEHGDGQNIEDLIAPPPPPPMDYDDLGDQNAFIPPPPQFLEVDSNANESQTLDKNSKPFATKSVSTWSCLDVLDWLDSLGLPQYRVSFAKACIDGTKLVDMGRNEFINLGVTQVGHRMNLERSVKKLNKPASTNL
ncbi:SH3 and multiple ankyrin repeat domains protein 1-like isoform X3 [Biomphalaria pfeifferi]|uniref:SH3 and multiple ankyrin repeat domains protein 1-like isoform X3 n=1 Tax=Biomphalaria pfeifferi TaxID=112525 RepID=A0AAD8BN58_BIOPF|nr:SH3 and multiple ankyrin repeat domains protein 1-like isoform X3 [Biomphalaria pfeifferi]